MLAHWSFAVLAFATAVHGHGVVSAIQGANNVTMPGLSIHDGVPRDCATPTCGAEQDTSVFQGNAPLGKNSFGTINAADNIQMFMAGTAAQAKAAGASQNNAAGGLAGLLGKRAGGGLAGLLGGLTGGAGGAGAAGGAGGLGALLGGGAGGGAGGGSDATGVKTPSGTTETIVADTAGAGAKSGLPTADESGKVTLTLHQVNQDGAGPFTADVDSTSGGTSEAAFQPATMISNVGGVESLSGVTTTDFPIQVQVPQGTVCSASVGGASNVCIVRVKNNALAGPFGGSAAFTQTQAAQKRGLEYQRRMKRRSLQVFKQF